MGLGLILQATLPLLFLPLANLAGEGEAGQVVSDQIQQLGGLGTRIAMAVVVGAACPGHRGSDVPGVLLKALGGFGRRTAIVVSALGVRRFSPIRSFRRSSPRSPPDRSHLLPHGRDPGLGDAEKERLGPAIFIHSGFNLLALLILLMPPI